MICHVFGVSRQSHYAWRQRRARRQESEEQALAWVRHMRSSQPLIGARKLYRRCPIPLCFGRDAFFELLRRKGLLVVRRRSSAPRTTYAARWCPWRNLLKTRVPSAAGEVVVSDITYLRLRQGHCYLSLITDAFSRKIVGSFVSTHLTTQGALRALRKALGHYKHPATLIHHSDRGTQYASKAYTGLLQSQGARISMTEKNHCAENSLAERVNGILKTEFFLDAVFESVEHARRAVAESIRLYNTERPHLSLDYLTPDEVHFNRPSSPKLCQLI